MSKSSERISRRMRLRVAKRACWRCEYCLTPAAFSTQPFEVDHVVPRGQGGPTQLSNLAFSCGCNSYKGSTIHANDPQTERLVRLFNPRRQRWARHFAWSSDLLVILGQSAIGRATVEALRLNRPELVNLRHALLLAGAH